MRPQDDIDYTTLAWVKGELDETLKQARHALEAYVSWTYNTSETLLLAEKAVCGIFQYLERAYRNGSDLKARQELLLASYRAGFAFTRAGVGNVHAIAQIGIKKAFSHSSSFTTTLTSSSLV